MIQPFVYSKNRVPFASDGSGNFLCFDFEPAEEGMIGQIIYLPLGEPDPLTAVANDFEALLQLLIDGIKTGTVSIEDDYSSDNLHLDTSWTWYYGWSKNEAKLLIK